MIAEDDPTAKTLFEAAWADPASDAPRMVLADYLLEQGDPMGEMIALQLERSRTGAPISERELELMVVHGRRMLGPAGIWIQRWVFERGFLVAATPIKESISREAAAHPLWSTVERIQLTQGVWHNVLDNPHLRSLRTLHLTDNVAFELSRRTEPLPIRALTGASPRNGLRFADGFLETFDHRGAFDRVRAMSLDAWHLERSLNVRPVLESTLIAQLEHLDLTFASVRLDDLQLWKRWFETSKLARLSCQISLSSYEIELEPMNYYAPTMFIYVEVERGGDTVIVQLDEPMEAAALSDALAIIGDLGGTRRRVIVEDTRDSNAIAVRQASLLDGLASRFAEVVAVTGPVRVREP